MSSSPSLTGQLPLSEKYRTTQTKTHQRQRPFGALFAMKPTPIDIDVSAVRYDSQRQIALINIDGQWVRLLDPRLGLTLHTTGTVPNEDEVLDKDEKY